jgi:hypothetical protein
VGRWLPFVVMADPLFKKISVIAGWREYITATTFISPPDDVIWHIIN